MTYFLGTKSNKSLPKIVLQLLDYDVSGNNKYYVINNIIVPNGALFLFKLKKTSFLLYTF